MLRQELRSYLMAFFYILFFVFFIHRLFFHTAGIYERVFGYITYPILQIHDRIVIRMEQQADDAKDRKLLQTEIGALVAQNAFLSAEVRRFQAQQIFLEQTEPLRQFAKKYDHKDMLIAKKLMLSVSDVQDVMYVDVGVQDGISKDDTVVAQNCLVGRVVETYDWYSKVALISDKRCRISAFIDSAVMGLCCGCNNGKIQFLFVPHYKKIESGQMLYSSGQGLVYPSDFALGYVNQIVTDLVSHVITIQPALVFKDIDYVYVLKRKVVHQAEAIAQVQTEEE